MTGIEVGHGLDPRRGEVYLDVENLFHGFLASRRSPRTKMIQDELFETPVEAEAEKNAVARMQRVLGGVIQWFERESGCSIAHITSAGKAERTVRTFLRAVSDPEDPSYAYRGTRNRPGQKHSFWIANRIKVVHTMVEDGNDVADRFLIARLDERLPEAADGTPFLAGSADDLVLSRFDLALGARGDPETTDAVIDVWAVLPMHERGAHRWDVLDKFGALGVYPHIPRDNVRFLAQLSAPDHGTIRGLFVQRRKRDNVRIALIEAADEVAGPVGTGDDAGAVSDAVAPLANVLALRPDLLDGLAPGASGRAASLGDPWTAEAVSSNVSRVIAPEELARFEVGGLGPKRLLEIVWLCAVLRTMDENPQLTAAQLRRFVTALDEPHRSWRWKRAAAALEVLVEMRLVA